MSIEMPGKPVAFLHTGQSNAAPNAHSKGDTNSEKSDGNSSTNTDNVNITPMAKKLNDLAKKISAEPIKDNPRIHSIKHDIEHGSYSVNTGRLAEKFFRFEVALNR